MLDNVTVQKQTLRKAKTFNNNPAGAIYRAARLRFTVYSFLSICEQSFSTSCYLVSTLLVFSTLSVIKVRQVA